MASSARQYSDDVLAATGDDQPVEDKPRRAFHPDVMAAMKPEKQENNTRGKSDGLDTNPSGDVTGFINGLTEIAGKGIANIPHAAAHGVVDMYRRITGGDTTAPDPDMVSAMQVDLSPNAQDVAQSMSTAANAPIPGFPAKKPDAIKPLQNHPLFRFGADYVAPVVGDVANIAPMAMGAKNLIGGMRGTAAETAAANEASIPARAQAAADAAASQGSMGAAGAKLDVSVLKPETQAELARLHAAGKTPDPDVLKRIAKAESVGVDLTEGQAQQHTQKMANEFNRRSEEGGLIGNRFDAQDDALTGALADAHREAAPTAVANSEIQNGQSTINGIRRYDAPIVAKIDQKYADARKLNGGNLELDGNSFGGKVAQALKPQGIGKFLPSDVRGIVDEISSAPNGRINLDDFEGYRSQLADAQREAKIAGRGNAAKAIGKVRDQFEQMTPTSDAAKEAKAAFDEGRKLYKARADEIEANPAYGAVVDDPKYDPRKPDTLEAPSDLADKFVTKHVLSGSQQATVRLRTMLAGDQEANEAITSEALRPLRKAAQEGKGFSQDSYNNVMTKINARPELVNDAKILEKLNDIGEVGKLTRFQRRGGVFNNSGSGSLLLQRAASAANSFPGRVALGAVPYGTEAAHLLGKAAEGAQARAATQSIKDALKPGAGLER